METFDVLRVTSITTLVPDITLVLARTHPGVSGIAIVSPSPCEYLQLSTSDLKPIP